MLRSCYELCSPFSQCLVAATTSCVDGSRFGRAKYPDLQIAKKRPHTSRCSEVVLRNSQLHGKSIMHSVLRSELFYGNYIKSKYLKVVFQGRKSWIDSRAMSSASIPHKQRTATEQRGPDLHHVILSRIDQVNDSIRLLQLQVSPTKPVKASHTPPCHSL